MLAAFFFELESVCMHTRFYFIVSVGGENMRPAHFRGGLHLARLGGGLRTLDRPR